ncbi:MAG: NHL repeat-containing protein [Candidatus Sumerlaeota bacterium]
MDEKRKKTYRLNRKTFLKGCLAAGGTCVAGAALTGMGTRGKAEQQSTTPEEKRSYPMELQLQGTIATGLKNLRAVASGPQNRIYAGGEQGVAVFAPMENSFPKIKREALMKTPEPVTAMAVDDEGNVYATTRASVIVFDADGKKSRTWGKRGEGKGDFRFITGIAVDSPVVAVADAGRRVVLRFAINGDLVDETEGFHVPSPYFDLAYGPQGKLHVANPGKHRIEIYDSTGSLLKKWGTFGNHPEGFVGCCNPTNLTVLKDGKVVTTEKGTPRLKVYSGDGEKILAYLGPKAFAPRVAGLDLAVGPNGMIAVADPATDEIRTYSLKKNESEQ